MDARGSIFNDVGGDQINIVSHDQQLLSKLTKLELSLMESSVPLPMFFRDPSC